MVGNQAFAKQNIAVFLYKQAVAWRITSPNQPVHLTPKARAFFPLAISEQNVAFAKSSLAFGSGDSHVILLHIFLITYK